MRTLAPNSTPMVIGKTASKIKIKSPGQKGSFGVTSPIGEGTTPYSIEADKEKEVNLMKNGAEVTNTGKSTLEITEIN